MSIRYDAVMGSYKGVTKAAAKRLGITLEEYELRVDAGQKWCIRCKRWHPVQAFGLDGSHGDGRKSACRESSNRRGRDAYQPKPRPEPGRRFVEPRDGDKLQARRRVNYLVDAGLLPNPNTVPCIGCGHIGASPPRHEYHHYLGYAPEHHEDVEPVCLPCHREREIDYG